MKNMCLVLLLVAEIPWIWTSLTKDKPVDEDTDKEGSDKCSPGLQVVFTKEITTALETCEDKNIDDFNCLAACFLQEMGMVREGEWQESAAIMAIDGMMDNSKFKSTRKRLASFWAAANECLRKYKEDGKKFPTDFQSGNCQDMEPLVECVLAAIMACPKD